MIGRDFKLSSSESTSGVGVFAKVPLGVVGAAFDLGFSVVLFVEWNIFLVLVWRQTLCGHHIGSLRPVRTHVEEGKPMWISVISTPISIHHTPNQLQTDWVDSEGKTGHDGLYTTTYLDSMAKDSSHILGCRQDHRHGDHLTCHAHVRWCGASSCTLVR